MPKLDWKSYEELVKDIYEQLGSATGVKILGHGKDCKYKGKSQVEHQIDVLTSHSDGLHDYLTDIECKYWDKKIIKDIVMKVHEIVTDCNFSKGIIVSKEGFTPDAQKYAKHVGIGLVELREMNDEDWKGRIRKIQIKFVGHWPELTQCHIELEEESSRNDVKQGIISGDPHFMVIDDPTKGVYTLGSLIEDDFFKEMLDSGKDTFTKSYVFEKGANITYQELCKTYKLKVIYFSGKVQTLEHTDVLSGSNLIQYYMKCIFEDVELLLDSNGNIVKQINKG